jgi:hypothetical protein
MSIDKKADLNTDTLNGHNASDSEEPPVRPALEVAFGATGDGVTDDRSAINASANAAATDGQVLRFPKGIYKIASNLTISVPVSFAPGARILVPTGVTITFKREIIDTGRWTIFTWTGTGVVRGEMSGCDVRPEWWGATPSYASNGTGVDCGPAIQAANDHLEARLTRGRLLFSAGMYGIKATLKVGADGITWQGAGKGKRHFGNPSLGQGATIIYPILNCNASGGPAIRIKNQAGTRRTESVTIRDMSISGDSRYFDASLVGGRWFQHGIEMNHVAKITLEDLVIEYCNEDGIYTAVDEIDGPDQSYVHNVVVSQCGRYGVNYAHGNEHLYHMGTVEFCGSTAGAPGVRLSTINGVHLSEVSIESNYGPGVEVESLSDMTMVGCGFEANSRRQAAVDPTDDRCVHVLIGTRGTSKSIRVRDCYFTASDGQGGIHKHCVRIENARSVQLVGNAVWLPANLGGTKVGEAVVPPASPSSIIYFDPKGKVQDDVVTDQWGLDVVDKTMPHISNIMTPIRGLSWSKQASGGLTYNRASTPSMAARTELEVIPLTSPIPPGFCKPYEAFEFFAVGSLLIPTISTATLTIRVYVGATSVWTGTTATIPNSSGKRPFLLRGEFYPTDTTHGQMWATFSLGSNRDSASPGCGSIADANQVQPVTFFSEASGFWAEWASGLDFKITGTLSAVANPVSEVLVVEKWHVRWGK